LLTALDGGQSPSNGKVVSSRHIAATWRD